MICCHPKPHKVFLRPSSGGLSVASGPKEDCVHFLVLTDVCGNRTYGVVAQYYRPLHVGGTRALPPNLARGGVLRTIPFHRGETVAHRGQVTCPRSHGNQT